MTTPFAPAEAALSRLLNNAPLSVKEGEQPRFTSGLGVSISTGLSPEYGFGDNQVINLDTEKKRNSEKLTIHVHGEDAEKYPLAVAYQVSSQLAAIPALKDKIHFTNAKEDVKKDQGLLDKLIKAGAPIPPAFKDWQGFTSAFVQSKSLKVARTDGEVTANIWLNNTEKVTPQMVADDIQARLPQIKEVLAERLSKYIAGGKEIKKADMLAALNQMDFSVATKEDRYRVDVAITIRSHAQTEALKQPGGIEAVVDKGALRASNILNSISDDPKNPQLQKALARAVFTAGTPKPEVLANILGRDDMHAHLSKTLAAFSAENPAHASDVQALLNSPNVKPIPLFDDAAAVIDTNAKGTISAKKDAANDLLITLQLPAGYSAAEAASAIASLNPAQEQPLVFSQVNNIQVVGATTPQAYQQAQAIFQQPEPQADNLFQNLTPLAQSLLQHIEEAHNDIENAVNMAAKAEAAKHTAPPPPPPTVPSTALRNITMVSPASNYNLSA